jgi:NhaP-type Na+/H+ or K+/H+ antiporter
MRVDMIAPSAAAFLLCCISGFADAQGFVHASRVWAADRFVWPELARSALGFAAGISAYWLSVRFMQRVGIDGADIQTVIWFAVTIIGVAIAGGRFGKWPLVDQVVAGAVIAGLAWLLVRSSDTP